MNAGLIPRLGLAMAGLDADRLGVRADAPGGVARGLIDWAHAAGFRAVQLNAAQPGIRPRELDRSGRRELAALLRRNDMACAGLDLWIPPEHFRDSARSDRAVEAVIGALELAWELAGLAGGGKRATGRVEIPAVCLTLPAQCPSEVIAAIGDAAARCGVRVADHAWPLREPAADTGPWIGVGIDPAAVLGAGEDPSALAARLGDRIAAARFSDIAAAGPTAGRVAPGGGQGRLDVLAYGVSLAAAGYGGWTVLDLRGVADQSAAATTAREAWTAQA